MRFSIRGAVAALLVLVVAAVCVRLGYWQLDRLHQRQARNAALESAMALPALPLADSLGSVLRAPAAYRYRRVVVRGRYDPSGELLLRGRADRGRPGVHLVTPLMVAGDTAVMVNRGWVASADAATVDPRPYVEPGPRVVEGILLDAPEVAGAGAHEIEVGGQRYRSYARLPLDSLRAAGPHTLLPLYVQELGDAGPEGAAPARVALPELDEGPHRSYAVQWFSFAAIAVGGLVLFLVRGRRPGG